jgi:putative membrane protein insertion efficiency factor
VSIGSRSAVACLRLYQALISPLFPPACRFHPSCSCYAIEAFEKFGFGRGVLLTLRRLAKCHPFHPGGYDPVR